MPHPDGPVDPSRQTLEQHSDEQAAAGQEKKQVQHCQRQILVLAGRLDHLARLFPILREKWDDVVKRRADPGGLPRRWPWGRSPLSAGPRPFCRCLSPGLTGLGRRLFRRRGCLWLGLSRSFCLLDRRLFLLFVHLPHQYALGAGALFPFGQFFAAILADVRHIYLLLLGRPSGPCRLLLETPPAALQPCGPPFKFCYHYRGEGAEKSTHRCETAVNKP